MTNLISKIPQLLAGKATPTLNDYNYAIDDTTKAIMQKGFVSLGNMGLAYSHDNSFDEFAATIDKPMKIATFIDELSIEDFDVAVYLETVAHSLNVNLSSTDLARFIWAANIINSIKNDDELLGEKLNGLFLSLQHAPAYKKTQPATLRESIVDFTKNINADKLGVNAQQIKNYLAISHMTARAEQELAKWIDFSTFTELSVGETKISSIQDAFAALQSGKIADFAGVSTFVKQAYLSTDDASKPGYCENALVQEYKANIILAALAEKLNLTDIDQDDTIGLNVLSRIKNIPALLAETRPLAEISGQIQKYQQDALAVAAEMTQPSTAQVSSASAPTTQIAQTSAARYTKQQLDMFNRIADKKLADLTKLMGFLTKKLNQKSKFDETEQEIIGLFAEFKVPMITEDELPITRYRVHDNVSHLLKAVQARYNEIIRCKELLARIRKKKKTDLNLEDVEFNKKFLGNTVFISGAYQEKVIRDYYRFIDEDPILKSNKTCRLATPTNAMARLQERAFTTGVSQELSDIFSAIRLTPAQQARFEQDKIEEQQFYDAQDANLPSID
ncbi:MAG: hypothetical protein IJY90_02470 [Clostridia bacterium]|nr:hypothetical protein [Clostridia bacterium]